MAQHSGRLTIFQAAAVDDPNLGHAAFRVLAALGTYSDKDGWCYPSQSTIAARLRITRQAVGKSILQLAALGYISIRHQKNEDGGKKASLYRLNLDRVDTMQPEVATPQPQVYTHATSEVASHATNHVATHATSEVAYNVPLKRPKETPHIKVVSASPRITLPTYEPDDVLLQWAVTNAPGVDVFVAVEQWRDHHTSRGTIIKDYPASFRTWLRNEVKFRPSNVRSMGRRQQPDPDEQVTLGNGQVASAHTANIMQKMARLKLGGE